MNLDKEYWQIHYHEKNTPWDIGHVSPPIREYVDGLTDKQQKILIPGAGNAHEANYLHRQGFQQVYVCDWAEDAFDHLRSTAPDFPVENLLINDFFNLSGNYDLILEQTFFCAISPSLRRSYVEKVATLLPSGAILAGLLFASHFEKSGPPFGGDEQEYRELFEGQFVINSLFLAKNSILPRANNELFFKLIRK